MSQQSNSNNYTKLIQANLAFINATLDLVSKYERDELEKHCYYHIEKFPRSANPIYDFLSRTPLPGEDDLDTFLAECKETQDTKTQKANKLPHPTISNIRQALRKTDQEYIDYFILQRPKAKIQLKLQPNTISSSSRASIISSLDPDIIKQMKFADSDLEIHQIKRRVNQYILDHELQDENKIKIDPILQKLFQLSDTNPIHYTDYHQKFRKKFCLADNSD